MKAACFPTGDESVARDERAALAHRFAAYDGRVIASRATAARETAAWITTAFDTDQGFDDIDYGRWRGHDIGAIAAREPAGVAAWLSDVHARPHGGESIAMLAGRVAKALERLARDAYSERCTVVTHAIVVKAALAHARAESLASMLMMDLAPLSSTSLGYDRLHNAWTVYETS